MFQLWKLVLLCGLLTGASASLLGSELDTVLETVNPVVKSGLQVVEDVLQTLNSHLAELQESTITELAENAKLLVDDLLSAQEKLLNVQISGLSISNIQATTSSDGQGITLRIPVAANVSVVLPVIGQVVDLKVNLDLLTGLSLKTDDQSGLVIEVLEECASDPANISLSLLNRQSRIINKVLDSVTDLLENTVSLLLKHQVCPLINSLLSSLDVSLLGVNIKSQDSTSQTANA